MFLRTCFGFFFVSSCWLGGGKGIWLGLGGRGEDAGIAYAHFMKKSTAGENKFNRQFEELCRSGKSTAQQTVGLASPKVETLSTWLERPAGSIPAPNSPKMTQATWMTFRPTATSGQKGNTTSKVKLPNCLSASIGGRCRKSWGPDLVERFLMQG